MGFLMRLLGLKSPPKKKKTPLRAAAPARAAPKSAPPPIAIPSLGRSDDGAFVDGKPTFYWADNAKDDLAMMLRCCDAELAAMVRTRLSPAPFYFERAAVLSRQAKDYAGEIAICERFFAALDAHYANAWTKGHADVRKGPKFLAMVKRRDRARELLAGPEAVSPAVTAAASKKPARRVTE